MSLFKSASLVAVLAVMFVANTPLAYAKGSADDGTRDQGKGDFNLDGTVQVTTGSDDNTPDQGRGDFNADGSIQVTAGSDDGTQDQGRGDVNLNGTAQVQSSDDSVTGHKSGDDSNSDSAETHERSSVMVRISSWFATLFSRFHF